MGMKVHSQDYLFENKHKPDDMKLPLTDQVQCNRVCCRSSKIMALAHILLVTTIAQMHGFVVFLAMLDPGMFSATTTKVHVAGLWDATVAVH